ncbi:type II secretory pathway, ATPase PulE/Tfp pilus assembly pathway, ATPase PilB [Burkholderiales bacterium JOSHI_001]|nr:type II secretory pathway, ATPase PulE/Tfp pilus assembly pathway, ATPase PilB [Burkholderiales bacterium JOSHI_001]
MNVALSDERLRPALPDAQAVERARALARAQGQGHWLDHLATVTVGAAPGAAAGSDNAALLAQALGLASVSAADLQGLALDLALVPFVEASGRLCAAFTRPGQPLLLVVTDPLNEALRLWLEQRLMASAPAEGRLDVQWAVADRDTLAATLRQREREVRVNAGGNDPNAAARRGEGGLSLSMADLYAADSPIVRLVNGTLIDALNSDASDIHIETDAEGLTVRYRLDGVLTTVNRVDGAAVAAQFISRLKVLSELDIAEQRVPQDGRLAVALGERDVALRVSIMPNLHGEDAVLRVLDRRSLSTTSGSAGSNALTIENLGLVPRDAAFARRMANRPHGLFLVTGPTGSGKTTTLYALLQEINNGLEKIVTIEDPVEYELKGVLQIPVNEAKGLSFARGLRSILRHDPDKIMVGEIRDADTATIAVQAALTGHQVFATVHANNVIDVVGRLTSMGTDAYNLAAALNGVLAQRLVRLNCADCAQPFTPDAATLAASGLDEGWLAGKHLKRSLGCGHCRGSGYRQRRAVVETLTIDDEMRALISQRAPLRTIRAAARELGMRSLRDTALELVASGQTTLEEINRVTTLDDAA